MKKTLAAKENGAAVLIIRILAVIAACAVFTVYAIKNRHAFPPQDLIVPFASLALFVFAFVAAVPSFVRVLSGKGDIPAPFDSRREETRRDIMIICIAALVIHLFAILMGAIIFRCVNSYGANLGFVKLMRTAWMKTNTDVQHYLDIANHWYVSEGDEALFIVFFPMFPMLVRGLNVIFHDAFLSAFILNTIATVAAAAVTYLALLSALGRKRARAGAFIYMLLPGAIFMNSPMTEPLFMLFTACVFFFLNKKKYLLAGLFTAFAGFTRSLGVLLAVPVALVGIGDLVAKIKAKEAVGGHITKLLIALVISTFGTLAYLWINYAVFGTPFKFFEYQWSNWHQKACPFFDTPRYLLQRFLTAVKEPDKILSLWGPELLVIFLTPVLMAAACRKLPASHMAYFLPYFCVAVGCTWLLSAVRYLCAALPVAAAAALPCEKKWAKALVFIMLIILYFLYALMYMKRWGIY